MHVRREHAMATRIQAAWRGHASRSALAQQAALRRCNGAATTIQARLDLFSSALTGMGVSSLAMLKSIETLLTHSAGTCAWHADSPTASREQSRSLLESLTAEHQTEDLQSLLEFATAAANVADRCTAVEQLVLTDDSAAAGSMSLTAGELHGSLPADPFACIQQQTAGFQVARQHDAVAASVLGFATEELETSSNGPSSFGQTTSPLQQEASRSPATIHAALQKTGSRENCSEYLASKYRWGYVR